MTHFRIPLASLLMIVVAGSGVVSTGCTSMRPIVNTPGSISTDAFGKIRPGDTVEVEMKSGGRNRFKVSRIDGAALVSASGERYERADIKQLKQQRFSHLKTWPLVGGIVVLTLVVIAAIEFASSGPLGIWTSR